MQKLVIATYRHLESDCKVDQVLTNASRVMRLAGGVHPRTGQLATIHTASGTCIDADALEARLRALLPAPEAPPSAVTTPTPGRLHRPRRHLLPSQRQAPTMADIEAALAAYPSRAAGHGDYAEHRNLLWGLVKACEEAGGSIDTAISLMEAHSPSATCGWDVAQVAGRGGDQATPGWFWGLTGGHRARQARQGAHP